jgi:hypothetical protein
MQSLVNPTLLLGGNVSFDHVLNISSFVPSKQGIIPLSLSTIPPSPRMVSIDCNDPLEPQTPSSTTFQIRGILRYIVNKVTSASILSSSSWKVLVFPKLVSTIYEFLTFDKIIAKES